MTRQEDPEDSGTEFFDLWSAETTDDVRRILVLHPPMRRTADAFEPFALLSKHHELDPTGSAETAMLMVTDSRWRDGVGNLVRRIEQSGFLGDDQLDLLAEAFLAADDALYWTVPDDWFSEEGIVIWVGEVDETENEPEEDEEDDGPTLARRAVTPPLRRWAAGRLVGREPERWGPVYGRARQLDARSAAGAVSGLLDVVGVLKAPAQEFLIEEAIRWPNHSVRKLAIALVAERKGAEAAYKIAIGDPTAGVRRWAPSLLQLPPAERTHSERPEASQPKAPKLQPPEPPTLF